QEVKSNPKVLSYSYESIPPFPSTVKQVTVILHQSREIDEQTTLGIRLKNGDGYDLRLPIVPSVQVMKLDDPPATIEALPDHRVRVTVELPCEPLQISVDPDKVLQDANPTNNHWKE